MPSSALAADERKPRAGSAETVAELEALRELIDPDSGAFEAAGLPAPLPPAYVVAVLVAHDGSQWLPDALTAVHDQTRRPDLLLGVDTGSTDRSLAQLRESLGAAHVRSVARTVGYGAAVAEGLAHRPEPETLPDGSTLTTWIWLLHDDCAPAPSALEELLRAAGQTRGVEILGPKVLDWDDPRHLLEVGLTVDRGGRRVTGLDPREFDQGQYDGSRDVLAVGTAGALVRADVWERLGGLDPRLPLFRDDIDLGWRVTRAGGRVRIVPRAEVRHVRAAATGRRHADAAPGVARRVDRSHALLVLLANCGTLALLGALPRAVAAGLLRSLGYLATRRPHLATDELAAVSSVLRPGRLRAARAWRRAHGGGAAAEGTREALRSLLVQRGARVSSAVGVVGDLITGGSLRGSGPPPPASTGVTETGPVSEDAEELLPADDIGRLRRLLLRPVLVMTAALAVLALIADRHLLGGGALFGGRLLPVPPSAVDLWRGYAATWHAGGVGGSPTVSAPWTPWLAIPATVFGGDVAFTVAALLLLAVPLSGLTMWVALRRLEVPTLARVWCSVTYATVPVVTGSIAGGRFDTVVAVIGMPLLVRGGAGLIARSRRRSATRSAWALGLGLAGVSAFAPQVWTFAAVVLAAAALFRLATGALRAFFRLLIPLGVAPLLALPWLPRLAADPAVLLTGLGRPGGLAGQPAALAPLGSSLLSFSPSQHGPLSSPAPAWLLIPVVLAAVTGLLSNERRLRLPVVGCWAVILLGWTGAVLAAKQELPGVGDTQRGFAGPALALSAAATVTAVALSSIRLRSRLSSNSFGARQIVAFLLIAVAVPVPVVLALRWTVKAAAPTSATPAGVLMRGRLAPLPADVLTDALAGGPGQRALFLSRERDGQVDYALESLTGPHLGDEERVADPTTTTLLNALVRDLGTARGTDAAELLSTFDVHVVAVLGAGRSRLTDALDAQPALTRRATGGYAGTLWQLTVPASRLQLLGPELAAVASNPAPLIAGVGRGPSRAALVASPPLRLATGEEGAAVTLPPGPAGRLVTIADSYDTGWQATLDGHRLSPSRAWGWAEAFAVPAAGGNFRLTRDSANRNLLLVLQSVALLFVLLLAAPALGRDRTADDGVEEPTEAADDAEEPAHPLHVPATIERIRAGRVG